MFADRHQSKSWQRKIIDAARANGELHKLRWYIEMDIPAAARRHRDHKIQCASHPPGFVPVIPLDQPGADEYAHLLLELFKSANPDTTFRLMLTDIPMLQSCRIDWYDWGDLPAPQPIDIICELCGLVGPGQPGQRLGCSRGCLAR
jgi:hypothetical protein